MEQKSNKTKNKKKQQSHRNKILLACSLLRFHFTPQHERQV